jgi:hypothetical protein
MGRIINTKSMFLLRRNTDKKIPPSKKTKDIMHSVVIMQIKLLSNENSFLHQFFPSVMEVISMIQY